MPENPLQNPHFAAFVAKNTSNTTKNVKLQYKYANIERKVLPYSYKDNTADSIRLSIEYHPANKNTKLMIDAPTIVAGLCAEGFIKAEEIRPICYNNTTSQRTILEKRDHTQENAPAYSLSEIGIHPKHIEFRFIGKNLDNLWANLTFWLENITKDRNPKARL